MPELLPPREKVLLPNDNATRFIYDDQDAGGGNRVQWVNFEKNHWRCSRDESLPSIYCGFNLSLSDDDFTSGEDFSGYTSLAFELDLQSTSPEITVFLRNFNPAYSTVEDGNSAQYIHFILQPNDLAPRVVVNFNEFRLAEWWLSGRNLAREYRSPEFTNITIVGMNLGGDLEPGDHEVTLNRIVLLGPWIDAEAWYLGLLIIWLGGAIGVLSLKMLYQRQQTLQVRSQYSDLHQRHRQLHDEARVLSDLSQRDGLSGLLNRYGLTKALEGPLTANRPCALLLVDIDHFKRINDRRGHLEGDQVIVQVAEILKSQGRASDIVARWGGEEFVLVLPATPAQEALALAERIRNQVFDSPVFAEKKLAVSVSIGVDELAPGAEFSAALARADRALYKAKELGRNCTVLAQTLEEPSD
ncbi:diguanylate cyclase [Gilvimarinus sp. DA14]|uniref:diguanylate cyclase n=1 Tax=Gilvimarinus sp. DA14 TaxID=2956798 RepID=UPI0020B7C460|nr:diguanylate cyclase [Gilvimarinus sp. DA14]UTF59077.1 diguanylate cyclase [Gilvimarinus sp. DA14]